MIARCDAVGGAAIGDAGLRLWSSEWGASALALARHRRRLRRRHAARR